MPQIDLDYGSAIHKAMEVFYGEREERFSPMNVAKAFEDFFARYRESFPAELDKSHEPKDPANTLLMLTQYSRRYAEEKNLDVHYIEVAGAAPISDTRSIHFKIDTICHDDRGYFVLEHKTTKRDSSAWADQFSLSVQVGTYIHALYLVYPEAEVYGAVINGMILRKTGNDFRRIPISKSKEMMAAWLWEVNYYIQQIEANFLWLSKSSPDDKVMMAFPRNPCSCCNFRTCSFHGFCGAWSNPLQRVGVVQPGFVVDYWNPMEKEKEARYVLKAEDGKGTIEERKGEDNVR